MSPVESLLRPPGRSLRSERELGISIWSVPVGFSIHPFATFRSARLQSVLAHSASAPRNGIVGLLEIFKIGKPDFSMTSMRPVQVLMSLDVAF
jgi:hypothetical protein